jgi:flavin reductase (DIM6/NTAB) family NADH-FMN oxidoreductase RutF
MLISSRVEQTEIDASHLRRAMGRFATGVTIVTAGIGDEIHGMTANSVTTVSYDPPLVLFCVNKTSRMREFVQEVGRFAINILSEEQEQLSRHFAARTPDSHNLPYGSHFAELAGIPVLNNTLATLACEVYQMIEAGDHTMVLGKVIRLGYEEAETDPLLYFRGNYRNLEQPAEKSFYTLDGGMRVHYEEW